MFGKNGEAMKNNIFLIGFMGAGKSSVAHVLHRRYGKRLIEMDEQIEKQEGRKISEIFASDGEGYFRGLETALLRALEGERDVVVSCGGGVPLRSCNVEAMRESGCIVYLAARPETIYERVRDSHNRPLLEGNMSVSYIRTLMEKRLPAYLAAADVTIETDGKSMGTIAAEIVRAIAQ